MRLTNKRLVAMKNAAPAILCLYLFFAVRASADENLAGFRHLATTQPAVEQWRPLPTQRVSLTNAAPVLLPFFNNGPVFELPRTELGDVWHRAQRTGDWGGVGIANTLSRQLEPTYTVRLSIELARSGARNVHTRIRKDICMAANNQIADLLGKDADSLLNYRAKGFAKDTLHLPGPDFVDRI